MVPRNVGTEIEDRLERCHQKGWTTTARHLKLLQNLDHRYSIMFGLRYHGVHGNTHNSAMAGSRKNDAGFVRPTDPTDVPITISGIEYQRSGSISMSSRTSNLAGRSNPAMLLYHEIIRHMVCTCVVPCLAPALP